MASPRPLGAARRRRPGIGKGGGAARPPGLGAAAELPASFGTPPASSLVPQRRVTRGGGGGFGKGAPASVRYNPYQYTAAARPDYDLAPGQANPIDLPTPGQFADQGASLERATFDRGMNLLRPGHEQAQSRLNVDLANRGLPLTSEAYTRATDRLGRQQGDQLENLALSSVGAGRAEQDRLARLAGAMFGLREGELGRRFGERLGAFQTEDAASQWRDALGANVGLTNAGRNLQAQLANQAAQQQANQLGLQAALGLGGLENQRFGLRTGRLGTVGGLGNQRFGLDTARMGTLGGLANQRFGLDTGRLGTLGGLANQRYATDTSRELGLGGLENQRLLGLGGLANQRYATDTQRDLGFGGLENQRLLGLGGLANQRYATDASTMLGLGGLANQRFGLDTQRGLGLGGLQNQRFGLDTNRLLGLGNLGLASRGQDFREYQYGRQRPYDEFGQLLGFAGAAAPRPYTAPFPGMASYGIQPPNYAQMAQQAYQARLQGQQAQQGNLWNAVGGLGSALIGKSDRRLKENIVRIGATDGGIPLYRYNFIGDTEPRIGPMAQEVREVRPDAVVEIGGVLHVDYAKMAADPVGPP